MKLEDKIFELIVNIADQTHYDRQLKAVKYAEGFFDGLEMAEVLTREQAARFNRLAYSAFLGPDWWNYLLVPTGKRDRKKMIRRVLNRELN